MDVVRGGIAKNLDAGWRAERPDIGLERGSLVPVREERTAPGAEHEAFQVTHPVTGHEDTVRFYALRLHEAGMIKSSPQKVLAQGTDWRFLNELKKELKA